MGNPQDDGKENASTVLHGLTLFFYILVGIMLFIYKIKRYYYGYVLVVIKSFSVTRRIGRRKTSKTMIQKKSMKMKPGLTHWK